MIAYRTNYKMQNDEWERLNQDQLQSWYWDARNRGMISSVRSLAFSTSASEPARSASCI